MDRYIELWDQTKATLETQFDPNTYRDNFADINNIYTYKNGYIYLVCPTPYHKNKLEMFYSRKINDVLKGILDGADNLAFKFITKKEIEEELKKEQALKINQPEPNFENRYRVGNINSANNFGNYVVGNSNRFAYLTASRVAQQPGVYANPLYIFGNVGLGKTHLAQAIGNFTLDCNINTKVLYIKAEDYVEDYGTAANNDDFEHFKKKYEDVDVLIMDDIQFLSKKEKTQVEFFKLFERLHNQNKQIILTSDRPAHELKDIMERLTTRFAMGISVDIQNPDIEHRIQILQNKILLEVPDPSILPTDVLEYLAESFPHDIRQLEGALRRLLFISTMDSLSVMSLDMAKQSLQVLLASRTKSEEPKVHKSEAKSVLEEVARYYMIRTSDIVGKSRQKNIVIARHMTCYLLKELFNLPFQHIGRLLGDRDHTTIMNSCERIKHDMEINEDLRIDVDNIITKVDKK